MEPPGVHHCFSEFLLFPTNYQTATTIILSLPLVKLNYTLCISTLVQVLFMYAMQFCSSRIIGGIAMKGEGV